MTELNQEPMMQQWPTGSRYIGTHKEPQDTDFLELTELPLSVRVAERELDGWVKCSEGYGGSDDHWESMRKGDLNLILCDCPLVYLRWVAFSELARSVFLADKVQRIELCKALVENDVTAARNVTHLANFNNEALHAMQMYIGGYK